MLKMNSIEKNIQFNKKSIKSIDRLMDTISRRFPINAFVRIISKKNDFDKRSVIQPWSRQKYQIYGYKRPSFMNEPVGIYLKDQSTNMRMRGIYYANEMKLIV